jgi:chromosome partitioning protein
VQQSSYSLRASAEMVEMIREAQVFRPTLPAVLSINRRIRTTVIGARSARRLD